MKFEPKVTSFHDRITIVLRISILIGKYESHFVSMRNALQVEWHIWFIFGCRIIE